MFVHVNIPPSLFLSHSQGGSIQNTESGSCLELVQSRSVEVGYQLVLQTCTTQKWTITNVLTTKAL